MAAPPTTPINRLPCRISGYLMKKGEQSLATWKKRWFVLQDNRIRYAQTEGGEFIDDIVLTSKTHVLPSKAVPSLLGKLSNFSPKRRRAEGCAFTVHTEGESRVYYLCAETPQECEQWMAAINEAIANQTAWERSRFLQEQAADPLRSSGPAIPVDEIYALLSIKVEEARDLLSKDVTGKSDPYAVVQFGLQKFQTKFISGTLTPYWGEEFRVLVRESERGFSINIAVYDHDKIMHNDFIGSCELDLSLLADWQPRQVWLTLLTNDKRHAGQIQIIAKLSNRSEVEAKFWRSITKHFAATDPGGLTRLELAGLAEGIRSALTDEEIDMLFAMFDENGDGVISHDEFCRLVTGPGEKPPLVQKLLPRQRDFVFTASLHRQKATVVLSQWQSTVEVGSPKARREEILVYDRRSKKLVIEKIPHYIKVAMRIMYSNSSGRFMVKHGAQVILKKLTLKQGKTYNSPKSVKDIRPFIEFHSLNEDEMLLPVSEYKNFNEFFYRKLKPSARPISEPDNPSLAVSPADCRLLVFPTIEEAVNLWIKGEHFTLRSVLRDDHLASMFDGGSLVICRLAPQDYHRFHSPVAGVVGPMVSHQGVYYTVNPIAINETVDVYSENKRTVTYIDSPQFGCVVFVAVGATMVGSVNFTVEPGTTVAKGDELGYFAFGGSTCLVLFQKGTIAFDDDLVINSAKPLETLIRMGDSLGRCIAKGQPAPGFIAPSPVMSPSVDSVASTAIEAASPVGRIPPRPAMPAPTPPLTDDQHTGRPRSSHPPMPPTPVVLHNASPSPSPLPLSDPNVTAPPSPSVPSSPNSPSSPAPPSTYHPVGAPPYSSPGPQPYTVYPTPQAAGLPPQPIYYPPPYAPNTAPPYGYMPPPPPGYTPPPGWSPYAQPYPPPHHPYPIVAPPQPFPIAPPVQYPNGHLDQPR